MQDEVVLALRALCARNAGARAFFTWADSERQNSASSTSIDVLERKSGLGRSASIALLKDLEKIGCGKYIVGRHRKKTRISWDYGLKSIARAARGEIERLDPVDLHLEAELEGSDQIPTSLSVDDENLSIGEAKRRLAKSLGVSVEQIEIIVKG